MNQKFGSKDIENVAVNQDFSVSLLDICKKYKNRITDSFFHDISKLLHEYTGLYFGQKTEVFDQQIIKAEECIHLAKIFFENATRERSIEQLLVALHILSFFEQGYGILDIFLIDAEFKDKIIMATREIDFKITVPDDAPYNEKKMIEVFVAAKDKKDFYEVIGIMDSFIYHSNIFSEIKYTWGALINFTAFLDKQSILKILEDASFEKIDMFLFSLKNDYFAEPNFNIKNNYLLLRMFKLWIEYLDDTYFKSVVNNVLPNCTTVLATLLLKADLHLENYLEVLRVHCLESFNYIMGQLLARDNSFLPIYLKYLSFGNNETSAFGIGFLRTFIDSEGSIDKNVAFATVESIKDNYFEHEVHSYSAINLCTGYLELFGYFFYIKYNTKNLFLAKLSKYSAAIKEAQNSWNHDNITNLWVEFYYFCLANIYSKFVFTEQQLKNVSPVLFDERNKIFYDEKAIENMKILLTNPTLPLDLEFKTSVNDVVKMNTRDFLTVSFRKNKE